MQTQSEIRELLESAGLSPLKAFGQNFLIDHNLMGKLLEMANPSEAPVVLEVGPGTGSLTEELLKAAPRLVSVEIDHGLGRLLADRLGGEAKFTLIRGDVLADKHHISPEVLSAVGPTAHLVSNLPYNISVPLIAQCLTDSWQMLQPAHPTPLTRFDRLTFTVQKEVADRLLAGEGDEAYGPVSVIVGLLGRAVAGPIVPASAFWPKPSIASRIVRIDFDPTAAGQIRDVAVLGQIVNLAFSQR
ncbi:MAG: ribosomal RNA small subunit methyltransferase A, partial [Planctomycetaceae bacterium]